MSVEILCKSRDSHKEIPTMKPAKTFALGLSIILTMTAAAPIVFAQADHVRWDIVSINFARPFTVSAGGTASALAGDGSVELVAHKGGPGSTVVLTTNGLVFHEILLEGSIEVFSGDN
jgi:hypothetical protein